MSLAMRDSADDPRFQRAVEISQEKIHTLADFWPLTGPLLDAPIEDAKARERWLDERGRAISPKCAPRSLGRRRFAGRH